MVNKKYKDRLFCLLFGNEEYKDNILSLYNAVVNKLFKRNLLENLKMDESVSLGEDLMVSAQAMAKAKKIAVLEKI